MKVLLSIKPEFAEKIFSGVKKYEYRKSIFRNQDVKTIVVYATRPVARIIGEFDVEEIVSDCPDEMWFRTQEWSGISREFFDSYFCGRRLAYAISIGDVRLYDNPIEPAQVIENFTAPQSYMYVDDALRPVSRPDDNLDLFRS